MSGSRVEEEERSFGELRRKVRGGEVLSGAVVRLLQALHFTGRVSVVVQNGRVLKSGYEEGYFRQHGEGGRDSLEGMAGVAFSGLTAS